jgi:hypothetical protein
MGFSETLKELFDQGVEVSKDLASKAGEKAQDWGAKGLEASRGFAAKAGAKLQELGEKGSLMLDIKQLESQTRKLIALLGAEVYRLYEQDKTLNAEDGEIVKILEQLDTLKENLEKKETELKNVGKPQENA